MDERLEAGRHHLTNGERALADGYLDESRAHFETALLQFRGPELQLGEAHALRGLAHLELAAGKLELAEDTVRSAIQRYQSVRSLLDRIDPGGVSPELRADAEEGEGVALVLLGDLMLRAGRSADARESLSYAREIYAGLGDVPSSAGVWTALGRLGARDGRFDLAIDALERATGIQERSGDLAGQASTHLVMMEVQRVVGDHDSAESYRQKALALATQLNHPQLLGRAHAQHGMYLAQVGRLAEAADAYEIALPYIRDAGDADIEAHALIGLGDVRSRLGKKDATQAIRDGIRVLTMIENQAGLGHAMLQLSHHAVRCGRPALGLAAAESARQVFHQSSPVAGVGQALRLIVKALAAMRQWPAVLSACHLRAEIVGESQPNAGEVRAFYRERANERVLLDLDLLSVAQLEARTEALLEQILTPLLEPLDLDVYALGTTGGALALTEALDLSATPAPASRRAPTPAPVERAVAAVGFPSMDDYAGLYSPPSTDGWDDPDDDFEEG